MDITFNCENCGQNLVIDESGAGLQIQCPKCSLAVLVPNKSTVTKPYSWVEDKKLLEEQQRKEINKRVADERERQRQLLEAKSRDESNEREKQGQLEPEAQRTRKRLEAGEREKRTLAEIAQFKPATFSDFAGQNKVITRLQLAIEAARLRHEPLDHILLLGPPGTGKATLAALIAKSFGGKFLAARGELITKAGELADFLTKTDTGDILFIENINRMGLNTFDYLAQAMSQFTLTIDITGPDARSVKLRLPQFTIIGSAQKASQVPHALLSLFPIQEQLEFYQADAISKVLEKIARCLAICINGKAIELIAQNSNGIPRDGINLLKRVRDYSLVNNADTPITENTTRAALDVLVDRAQEGIPTDSKRVPIPREVRVEVWRRDAGKCAKCGSREKLEFDHIIPVTRGGGNTVRNIELLCEKCNRSKSDTIG
jgi:Holliday junction DNA helicase RuvB